MANKIFMYVWIISNRAIPKEQKVYKYEVEVVAKVNVTQNKQCIDW